MSDDDVTVRVPVVCDCVPAVLPVEYYVVYYKYPIFYGEDGLVAMPNLGCADKLKLAPIMFLGDVDLAFASINVVSEMEMVNTAPYEFGDDVDAPMRYFISVENPRVIPNYIDVGGVSCKRYHAGLNTDPAIRLLADDR